MILSWFVDVEVANSAIAGDKIVEENDIEVRPEKISVSCLDENVCLEYWHHSIALILVLNEFTAHINILTLCNK